MRRACTALGVCVGGLLLPALPVAAAGPLALPGYTWGTTSFPNSPQREERENLLVEGAVEQGADWFDLHGGLIFNTFGRFRYTVDSERFDYNNKLQPELGVKLKKGLGTWGLVELGARYVVEYRFRSGRTDETPNVFLNWGASWDLLPRR